MEKDRKLIYFSLLHFLLPPRGVAGTREIAPEALNDQSNPI